MSLLSKYRATLLLSLSIWENIGVGDSLKLCSITSITELLEMQHPGPSPDLLHHHQHSNCTPQGIMPMILFEKLSFATYRQFYCCIRGSQSTAT